MELKSISPLGVSLPNTSCSSKISKVRFLTLNLYLRPPPIHENESDYKELRTQYFIEHILPNYDIICLQEVFDLFNSRKERIISAALELGFVGWAESPVPSFWSSCAIDGGLLILSRFLILETAWKTFRIGTFPDSLCDKGALYCKLDVGGTPVSVITTHTQSSYPTIRLHDFVFYREVRRQQLRTARELVDEKYVPGELMVILGDLNVDAREDRQPSPFGVKSNQSHEIGSDYTFMYKILSGTKPDALIDVMFKKYGDYPATFGRIDEEGNPIETVLSNKELCGVESCLDYILAFHLEDAKWRVDWEDTKMEPFNTPGQPFTQISDHCALQMTIVMK